MFTVDVGMDVLGADAETLCKLRLQAAGVQDRAGTEDLVLRQAGSLIKNIRQNINGVGNDDVDRVRRSLDDLRRDLLDDIHVALRQLQPGLAGFSGKTRGDDHDVGVVGIVIVTGADDGRGAEGRALIDVQRLSEGFFPVDVDQQDLCGDSLNHQVVCNG